MNAAPDAAARYFDAIAAALEGLGVYFGDRTASPFQNHGVVAEVVAPYIGRLERSFACWQNRLGFMEKFRIQRAESGYPVFQSVLELENDKRQAEQRLAGISAPDELRAEMVDFILRHRAFPAELQRSMAERLYLEEVKDGTVFSPFILPETVRVSVNPKTGRPYYLVHWGAFDGSSSLPMVYMAAVEDSSPKMIDTLVADGRLNERVEIGLPVGGLLNPELAHRFDEFAEKNSAYSLSPATIAGNLDKDFEHLHPKQLRRVVLGPFYTAGITENNSAVSEVLSKVRRQDNAWLITWTVQEVYSKTERPARKGLWSSQPAREEFHIDTDDLDAARMGVSAFEQHALVPHEAYQALYAAGEAQKIFEGYDVHVISGGKVITDV
ncbi:hypothetical protein [Nitratireductor pacificus]|uniref:Uncharacterized protein n=1 Tax=Nitratireductor pacificus pht-3B TaxID=391937 RepID=K2MJS7_9HYPH|nr:hypothetical protein [Nitratireductor pacificus]EKF17442.1 hypothetical protein NA2_18056 [Nitratireductor pacificus pht-3B]